VPKFRFKAQDALVLKALNGGQILGVENWQLIDSYFFHLHSGHAAGWPLYVANRDGKSMSKWNLLDKTADTIEFMDNGSVTAFELEEASALLTANFDCFVSIAATEYQITASKAVVCPKKACKSAAGRKGKDGKMRCLTCGDILG
jgi:uncharacterized protein YuzE